MSDMSRRKSLASFAERVVEQEILLSQPDSDFSQLKNLTELLVVIITKEGIEFYQSINDNKYLYYKEKLDKVLINNQHMLKQTRYQPPEVQAADTIRDYERRNSDVSQKISSNISVQNKGLNDRLSVRRKSFSSGDWLNSRMSREIEKLVKEKKDKVGEVIKKYEAALSKENYIITIEQMNREVEKLENEMEQKKKTLANQIMAKEFL